VSSRRWWIGVIGGVILLGGVCGAGFSENGKNPNLQPGTPVSGRTSESSGYALVWSDEFTGSSLDTSKWFTETGNRNGWGNNELQYYQNQNITVVDGHLIITAKRENVGGCLYTSGRMRSLFDFQYGRVVARIKLTPGQGLWPAFWMLGKSFEQVAWPTCGEIDIMENIGDNTVYAACHWYHNGHASYSLSTSCTVANWHEYEVEWDDHYIVARIDGREYYRIDINPLPAFRAPFNLLLNLAVGGNWPGSPNAQTPFPATMEVDYVRVYQKSLTLLRPNGGESWRCGQIEEITWNAVGIDGAVTLELLQGDILVGPIAEVTASAGKYTWLVGTWRDGRVAAGENYRIRVRTNSGEIRPVRRFSLK